MGILSKLFGNRNQELMKLLERGATVIDVRTPAEYMGGHVVGSINIPMEHVNNKLNKIKKMKMPLVLCCASGVRSANATYLLKNNNINEVYNGGRWSKIARLKGN